jgi:hypothetical protein
MCSLQFPQGVLFRIVGLMALVGQLDQNRLDVGIAIYFAEQRGGGVANEREAFVAEGSEREYLVSHGSPCIEKTALKKRKNRRAGKISRQFKANEQYGRFCADEKLQR